MTDRLKKKVENKERMIQREIQIKKNKTLRLNFVAGILNRFYKKWCRDKNKSVLFDAQNKFETHNLFEGDPLKHSHRSNHKCKDELFFHRHEKGSHKHSHQKSLYHGYESHNHGHESHDHEP